MRTNADYTRPPAGVSSLTTRRSRSRRAVRLPGPARRSAAPRPRRAAGRWRRRAQTRAGAFAGVAEQELEGGAQPFGQNRRGTVVVDQSTGGASKVAVSAAQQVAQTGFWRAGQPRRPAECCREGHHMGILPVSVRYLTSPQHHASTILLHPIVSLRGQNVSRKR